MQSRAGSCWAVGWGLMCPLPAVCLDARMLGASLQTPAQNKDKILLCGKVLYGDAASDEPLKVSDGIVDLIYYSFDLL